jgi:cytochrome c-type biogenesis protein CcmH
MVKARMVKSTLLVLVLLASAATVHGAIDAYPFPNVELQQRYDNLIAQLRCPQCLNTNLAGSDAMIAQDLRREVHEMLIAGSSDKEILDFMYTRYGDFILYEPRVSSQTVLLWFGPLFLILVSAFVWYRMTRRKQIIQFTDEDEQRFDTLVNPSEVTKSVSKGSESL